VARTWFITGINGGFGLEFARQLLARGDVVRGTARRIGDADVLLAQYPDRFHVTPLDLTDRDGIAATVTRAFADLRRIDVIVHNAGYGLFGAAESLSEAQVEHQIATNLTGPIHLTRAALPYLRAQGGGRLIALSTYGGQATHPGASLYHASKWGLEGFFDALAAEVAPFGIGVTIVEPGGARTAFRETAKAHLPDAPGDYANTPVGMIRETLDDPARAPIGDPKKMVSRIIASADVFPAPKRLVLGSDSYAAIQKALSERLAAVEAQKKTAPRTDG
jgi:NAD(P)-dependent dehydrogenase (short-subunit alcohol dehydrogenase family)